MLLQKFGRLTFVEAGGERRRDGETVDLLTCLVLLLSIGLFDTAINCHFHSACIVDYRIVSWRSAAVEQH